MSKIKRQPHADYMIAQELKRRAWDNVQKMCDENEEYFSRRIQDMQDQYMRAQMGKMKVRPMTKDELAVRYGPAMKAGAES
jgi:hypothetical protein